MLVLVVGLGLVAAAVVLERQMATVAMAVALVAALAAWYRTLLRWPVVVGLLISIMLFVPVGRYSISINLPFGLELYRLTVALLLACWLASLLVDSRVRLRRSPFDRAVALVVCATLASIAVNPGRVAPLQGAVLKSVTFFLSFVLLYFFIVSVVRGRHAVESLTKLFVAGAAIVAVFATVEQRTGFNLFDRIGSFLPFLRFNGIVEIERFGVVRAVGSSAHPIELGVVLAMALPLGLALVFSSSSRWWIPTGALAVGVMTSVSRTPLIVLAAAGLILLWLRPRDVKKLVPLLVPLIVVVKLALPGSLATVKQAFFPEGGLVAEHSALPPEADPLLAGGRVRLLGPSLDEAARSPVFGRGFGTRQTGFHNPLRNSPILDNQWLGLLLDIGIVGVVGWAVLLTGAARRLIRSARRRAGPDGWLSAGFAAAIAGFSVAMFTFDAMAFVQVTFMLWILIGLSASLLLAEQDEGG
jgi:polysaccharide biosynthesis protein PslJ